MINEALYTIQQELKKDSKKFIGGIRRHTVPLKKELQNILGIDSLLQLPDTLSDLFLILNFSTKVKGTKKEISLKRRGDGVKVRHIPAILKFLADKERVHHTKGDVREDTIWGYEEPENNLELRAAFALAGLIKKYSDNIQMFITTHSPVFYRLGFDERDNNKKTLAYEVFQREEKNKKSTDLREIDLLDEVDDKMGLLPLITPYVVNKEEEIRKINKENELLQKKLNSMDKDIVLFVEGKHDKNILENAWKKLNPNSQAKFIIHNLFDCFAIENILKRGEVFRNDPDKIYIGMLDFDKAYECFERLEKQREWNRHERNKETGLSLIHKKEKGSLFLLPVPNHRLAYADEKYKKDSCLTIELLFEDDVLEGFVEQIEKVGNSQVLCMPDNKKEKFAKQTINFTYDNFRYFKIIFKKIHSIVANIKVRDL